MNRILITGGTNGLGAALAKEYVQRNDDVVVLDTEINEGSENIKYIKFDLAHFDPDLLNEIKDPMDIVICNAGISVSGDFVNIPIEKEREVFEINFFGHLRLIKYLLERNLIKEKGRVAFVASASVFLSFPIALAYAASKSALDGFAHALESYVVGKDISITRIYPGPMNTQHSRYYPGAATEGGRRPEQSAPAIIKAIDKRKRQVRPDPLSKMYGFLSGIIPRQLSRKTYRFYQDRIH